MLCSIGLQLFFDKYSLKKKMIKQGFIVFYYVFSFNNSFCLPYNMSAQTINNNIEALSDI